MPLKLKWVYGVKMKGIEENMNILSLFDGMAGLRQSLKEINFKVDKYYASEVDNDAIKIANKNHNDIFQLGDVNNWHNWNIDFSKIDLLVGGSPCQGFSVAGKKLNFEDERSALFFKYCEILQYAKNQNPNIKFVLENVKMPDDISNIINDMLGVNYQYINSKDFSGMIRKRYYWFNGELLPYENKDVKIKDLIETLQFDKSLEHLLSKTIYNPTMSSDGIITINPRQNNGKQTWQRGRVYDIKGNCPTICATLFDLSITENHNTYRKFTQTELETLQGFPKGYTNGVSIQKAGKMLGNGFNVPTISHIIKSLFVGQK